MAVVNKKLISCDRCGKSIKEPTQDETVFRFQVAWTNGKVEDVGSSEAPMSGSTQRTYVDVCTTCASAVKKHLNGILKEEKFPKEELRTRAARTTAPKKTGGKRGRKPKAKLTDGVSDPQPETQAPEQVQ